MTDTFRTLDLSLQHNAGLANVDLGDGHWLWPHMGDDPQRTALAGLPTGNCRFLGVPFCIGDRDGDNWFVQVAGAGCDTEQ